VDNKVFGIIDARCNHKVNHEIWYYWCTVQPWS